MSFEKNHVILDTSIMDIKQKQPLMKIERPVYLQDDLNEATLYKKPKISVKSLITNKIGKFTCKNCIFNFIPVLHWISYYKWKKYITGDILSGITVAIMNIPQGMAYGILGNLAPVVGIYMAFFPVLIYFFFGTSRHASMGTFSLVCLLTGKVVNQYSSHNATEQPGLQEGDSPYTPIEIAVTVTFTVACMQLIMYCFRLGILTTLLSDTLVQGFTCGAAVQVVGFQLKHLLGLQLPKRSGYFTVPYTVYDSLIALPQANRIALAVTMITLVTLVLNNEIFKPILAKRTKIPFPIELVAVVLGTFFSWLLNLENNYNVRIVGDVPAGLPDFGLPRFTLIPYILFDCMVICMIAYSVTISMALIIAQKENYQIDANQELLAMGLSNIFGSFFSCMPFCASLSRTVIQHAVGGVTQIASIVSCFWLLIVLLWIGPYFQTLPTCVLASIIVVSLKSMLQQIEEVPKIWMISQWDAIVWIITFTTTVIISVDIGLISGICASVFSLLVRGYKAYTCLLGVYPKTDLYLDVQRYKGVQEIPGIKIFHFCGSLNFASHLTFKTSLYNMTGFDPAKIFTIRNKMAAEDVSEEGAVDYLEQKCIIIDLSACTYIDHEGVNELRFLKGQYRKIDVVFYLATCSGPVYEMLKKCDKREHMDSEFIMFPTVHDAVTFCKENILKGTNSL